MELSNSDELRATMYIFKRHRIVDRSERILHNIMMCHDCNQNSQIFAASCISRKYIQTNYSIIIIDSRSRRNIFIFREIANIFTRYIYVKLLKFATTLVYSSRTFIQQ